MDKKNTVIGVLLLVAAMASFYISARHAPQQPVRPPTPAATSGSPLATNEAPVAGPASSPSDATLTAAPAATTAPAKFATLANEFLEVRFTDRGGAIDSIALLHKAAHLDAKGKPASERYTLNANQAAPALSLTFFPGAAPTKAYTLALGEALYEELREHGVDVLALVPGMTDTPLFAASQPVMGRARSFMQTPEDVVAGALVALGKQPVYISSASDRMAANVLGALLPRKVALKMARRSMGYFFPHLADKKP